VGAAFFFDVEKNEGNAEAAKRAAITKTHWARK
jgi:hypothetical protein